MTRKVFLGDIELTSIASETGAGDVALSRFNGKKIIVTGDSITEKNFRATLNWHDYLSTWLGFGSVYNDGKSGTGLTRAYGSWSGIYTRIDTWASTYTASPDYILVMASMNDGGGDQEALATGTIADTGIGTSYYANCKAVVEKLLTNYPNTPIGIISSIPRSTISTRNGVAHGYTAWYEEWCNALKAVCDNYHVPFLDLYHTVNLRPWIDTNNATYFSCSSSPDGDGIHPNALGQEIMAYRIYEFVKQYL